MEKIVISRDFSDAPGGRFRKDGEKSGQEFREDFLEKYFLNKISNEKIIIDFDGAFGYATSFLEEAFGGLSRKFGVDLVINKFDFVSYEEPSLIIEVKQYIKDASKS